jgi:hypothetical protein
MYPHCAFVKDVQVTLTIGKDKTNLFIIGLDANNIVWTGHVNAMICSMGLCFDVHCGQHHHLPTASACNKNNQDIPVQNSTDSKRRMDSFDST